MLVALNHIEHFGQRCSVEHQTTFGPGSDGVGVDLHRAPKAAIADQHLVAGQKQEARVMATDIDLAFFHGDSHIVLHAVDVVTGTDNGDLGGARQGFERTVESRRHLEQRLTGLQFDLASPQVPTDRHATAAIQSDGTAIFQFDGLPLAKRAAELLGLVGRIQPCQSTRETQCGNQDTQGNWVTALRPFYGDGQWEALLQLVTMARNGVVGRSKFIWGWDWAGHGVASR
ncbi:hypothetical protein D3C84_604020 [compost metagenome]